MFTSSAYWINSLLSDFQLLARSPTSIANKAGSRTERWGTLWLTRCCFKSRPWTFTRKLLPVRLLLSQTKKPFGTSWDYFLRSNWWLTLSKALVKLRLSLLSQCYVGCRINEWWCQTSVWEYGVNIYKCKVYLSLRVKWCSCMCCKKIALPTHQVNQVKSIQLWCARWECSQTQSLLQKYSQSRSTDVLLCLNALNALVPKVAHRVFVRAGRLKSRFIIQFIIIQVCGISFHLLVFQTSTT